MKLGSFDTLVRALDKAAVRYLVAGGLAVNAHGYLRFTRDVDLVLQLAPGNIVAAFRALEGIGYRPIVPERASIERRARHQSARRRVQGFSSPNFQHQYGRIQ